MKRQGRDSRWIYCTTGRSIVLIVLTYLTTMFVTAQSTFDDLLDVDVPVPEFLPGASNISVREGDVAFLPCHVRHLGTKQVAWRRIDGDKFLTIGTMTWAEENNVSLNHSRKSGHVTTWDLVIHHVRPEDGGLYECQVTSRAGHVRLVQLNVVVHNTKQTWKLKHEGSGKLSRKGAPRPESSIPNVPVSVCGAADMNGCLISITGKMYVDLGDKIHLVCNASGGPRIPDEIDWFKAGDKIDSSKYRHVVLDKYQSIADSSFISELIIEHSQLSDTGDYICRSSRNDIANLKVTVLYAETANKRRGTGPWPTMGRNHAEDSSGTRQLPISTATVFVVLLTLYSSFPGLYS
ncbi:hypothetical protein BsWGS_00369 [Bradybaena similaris]